MKNKTVKDMYQKYVKYYGNEHIFDIFENKRLYASPYQNLNDCAEGDFYILGKIGGTEIRALMDDIKNEKSARYICCFSKGEKNYDNDRKGSVKFNPLMWAHYADGGKGIMINFHTVNSACVREVKYVNSYPYYDYKMSITDNADFILTHKINDWKYENEYRILTDSQYVDIEIKSVVAGFRFNKKSGTNCMPDTRIAAEYKWFKSYLKEKKIALFSYEEYYGTV